MEDAPTWSQQWKVQKNQKPIHDVKDNYNVKNDRTVLHIIWKLGTLKWKPTIITEQLSRHTTSLVSVTMVFCT